MVVDGRRDLLARLVYAGDLSRSFPVEVRPRRTVALVATRSQNFVARRQLTRCEVVAPVGDFSLERQLRSRHLDSLAPLGQIVDDRLELHFTHRGSSRGPVLCFLVMETRRTDRAP